MTFQHKVTLEKNVPYPSRRYPRRFPFEAMEVGDSFLADFSDKATIYYHMKMHAPKRFMTRTVKEDGAFVIRVWRVA